MDAPGTWQEIDGQHTPTLIGLLSY